MRNVLIPFFVFTSAVGFAQQEFTEFVGVIKAANAPTALAADSSGRLYYGTFNHTGSLFSHVRIIEDPLQSVGTAEEAGTTVVLMGGTNRINAASRGVQTLVVASDNTLFIGGDNSAATNNNLWKYDYTPGTPPVFTEDTTFTANIRAERPGRRSGVSIVSEAGAGLLITCGFGATSFVDYFDFAGHAIGTRMTDDLYYRDIHYIPQHNIAYPFRNGNSTFAIVSSYISGIDPVTGGGTLNPLALIPEGGSGGTTGHSMQGGYYFEAQDQLFVCESQTATGPPPRLRVFDVQDGGTSLSLAYEITGTSPGNPFVRIYDAVVSEGHLYICGYNQTNTYETSNIYVFREPDSAVDEWTLY